jgi:hypothetical protein
MVMAGLVPAIHASCVKTPEDVDPGLAAPRLLACRSQGAAAR